ncbi:MAG: helix-turn-helix transcriptional regulator [Bdellovibrionaceae bacterium]|nr:helix-turn-helix transcriptional regulator [Pseudobdellovibrionaceae bacterium]
MKPDQKEILARRVKSERIARNMSQNDLCDATGISRSALSHIENGSANTSMEKLEAIAKAFEISIAELLSPDTETINYEVKTPDQRVNFSQRVRVRMTKMGISTLELARRADILPNTMSNYVNGTRGPDVVGIRKIAAALGVSPEELMSDEVKKLPAITGSSGDADLRRVIASLEAKIDQLAQAVNLLDERQLKSFGQIEMMVRDIAKKRR